MHHSGCDVVPVEPSQVLRQRQHGGQFLLTELPVVPSAEGVPDQVCGGVGVKSRGDTGPPSHQEFMHPTQIQLSLRRSNGGLEKREMTSHKSKAGASGGWARECFIEKTCFK